MTGFSFGGLATGLDTNTIIDQLVLLESRPLRRFQGQREDLVARQGQFSQFKSRLTALDDAVQDLADASKLSLFETNSTDESKVRLEASSGAVDGQYAINVIGLAERRSVNFETGFADADTADVGAGNIDITANGQSTSIAIDAGDTLNDVRNKINDGDLGVQASVVYDGTNYNLVLTSDESGLDNSFTVDQFNLANGGPLVENELQDAQDASFEVNGLAVSASSNEVEGAIEGVTIILNDVTDTNEEIETSVARDNDAIADQLDDFISSYNGVLDYIDGQDDDSDIALRGIKSQLQSAFQGVLDGADGFDFIGGSQIGLETNSAGRASLDRESLDDALDQNYGAFIEFFSGLEDGTSGFAAGFDTALNGDDASGAAGILTSGEGALALRQDTIASRIRGLDDRIARAERRLDLFEERETRRFAALEQLTAQLQAQGASLAF